MTNKSKVYEAFEVAQTRIEVTETNGDLLEGMNVDPMEFVELVDDALAANISALVDEELRGTGGLGREEIARYAIRNLATATFVAGYIMSTLETGVSE